ncbi:hypothetical protein BN1723_008089 [Verticillium longisporum]|uniref:Uncharacterized protein n=1 Tax=Verticillium longisporum TaxID=100787 RepID=A0A0G4NQI3_VERLO|nr:hypothetical protein BN1723_008089 [Verticillium longisporum]
MLARLLLINPGGQDPLEATETICGRPTTIGIEPAAAQPPSVVAALTSPSTRIGSNAPHCSKSSKSSSEGTPPPPPPPPPAPPADAAPAPAAA